MAAVDLPEGSSVFLNGKHLETRGKEWTFGSLLDDRNVIAIEVPGDHRLVNPFQFVSGTRPFVPSIWARTGLRFYSGSAAYERQFTLSDAFLGAGKQVVLDCGKVGVVAEVWVNGKYVDTKVWEPYAFDITPFVHTGENALKIIVSNTMANASDVGERFPLIQNIDLDGLVGPVRIVPKVRARLNCQLLK
jgi:beta-galactosidase/beta-glucuronidase